LELQEVISETSGKLRRVLVGGLEHVFFQNIWDVILPIDELIFFKMVETTNQNCSSMVLNTKMNGNCKDLKS